MTTFRLNLIFGLLLIAYVGFLGSMIMFAWSMACPPLEGPNWAAMRWLVVMVSCGAEYYAWGRWLARENAKPLS